MMWTGLKKCSPMTRAGVRVASAIAATDRDEVFVARIASDGEDRPRHVEVLDDRLDDDARVCDR